MNVSLNNFHDSNAYQSEIEIEADLHDLLCVCKALHFYLYHYWIILWPINDGNTFFHFSSSFSTTKSLKYKIKTKSKILKSVLLNDSFWYAASSLDFIHLYLGFSLDGHQFWASDIIDTPHLSWMTLFFIRFDETMNIFPYSKETSWHDRTVRCEYNHAVKCMNMLRYTWLSHDSFI